MTKQIVKKSSWRSQIFRRILIAINLIFIAAYLLTCLIPYLNPVKFWVLSFLGLAFPFIAFGLLGFVILWSVFRSKWALYSLLTLLIGVQQLNGMFAFHLSHGFINSKPQKTIRVLQYNIKTQGFVKDVISKNNEPGLAEVLSLLKETNADVITLQEYFAKAQKNDSSITLLESLGYEYHYFAESNNISKINYDGVAIFSKFPIVNKGTLSFSNDEPTQDMIYADVKIDGKIFRIFSIHLQSIRIGESHYKNEKKSEYRTSASLITDKTIASKIGHTSKLHYEQSLIVRRQIDQSPHPVIVCGDFNAVPNSNTYFTVKGNLQDAFLKKGSFIGRTFRYISPTLRIDYIFADPLFKVSQFTIPSLTFSDHFPVIADLEYP